MPLMSRITTIPDPVVLDTLGFICNDFVVDCFLSGTGYQTVPKDERDLPSLAIDTPEMIRIALPMILPQLYHNCAIFAIGFSKKYQISGRCTFGVVFLRPTRDFALARRLPSAMAFSDFAHSFGPCM